VNTYSPFLAGPTPKAPYDLKARPRKRTIPMNDIEELRMPILIVGVALLKHNELGLCLDYGGQKRVLIVR
jgi:hypothetical protein